jgi:hypothetical protein
MGMDRISIRSFRGRSESKGQTQTVERLHEHLRHRLTPKEYHGGKWRARRTETAKWGVPWTTPRNG